MKKPLLEARKVGHLEAPAGTGLVTYCVNEPPPLKKKQDDRREPPRKRTRLRCGKILNQKGTFLIECQIHDRSASGAQLRLMGAVALPRMIKFFDDERGALLDAQVIWKKDGEIGIRFLSELNAEAFRSGRRSALGSKYYAVP